jgi:hypothetical protein
MPLEKDDAIAMIQTVLSFLKVAPEPNIQDVLQTYSAFKGRLKEHNDSAKAVSGR